MDAIQNTNKKRRFGRAKLPAELRRGWQFKPGYTQDEYQRLQKRAEQAGMPAERLSEFIKKCSLGQSIFATPAINREALVELNRIGNNINQIARVLNGGGAVDTDQVHDAFTKLTQKINQIGRQLTGVAT